LPRVDRPRGAKTVFSLEASFKSCFPKVQKQRFRLRLPSNDASQGCKYSFLVNSPHSFPYGLYASSCNAPGSPGASAAVMRGGAHTPPPRAPPPTACRRLQYYFVRIHARGCPHPTLSRSSSRCTPEAAILLRANSAPHFAARAAGDEGAAVAARASRRVPQSPSEAEALRKEPLNWGEPLAAPLILEP